MYEKAAEKLTSEMTANTNHPYVQVVGEFLLKHLESNPDHAEKFLLEEKTILKSLDTMRRYALTKRVGDSAVVTEEEGFGVVLQYFDCWEGEPFKLAPEPAQRPAVIPTPAKTQIVSQTPKSTKTKPTKLCGQWEQTSFL